MTHRQFRVIMKRDGFMYKQFLNQQIKIEKNDENRLDRR